MSRGQFQTRIHANRSLGRCSNIGNTEKLVIEVDEDDIDYATTSEKVPMSSHQGSRCSRVVRPSGESSSSFVIRIDDEDSNDNINHNRVSDTETSSKTFIDGSSSSSSSEEDDSVMFVESKDMPSKLPKNVSMFTECENSRSLFGLYNALNDGPSSWKHFNLKTHETYISDDDTSDCEIMDDSSGNIREEWEKAALRRRGQDKCNMSEENSSGSGSDDDCRIPSVERIQENANFKEDRCNSLFSQSTGNGQNLSNPGFHASTYTDDINVQTCPVFYAREKANAEIPSTCEKVDFLNKDAPFGQPSSSRQSQGDKHVFATSCIYKEDVLQNSSWHTTIIGEKFCNMEKVDLGKPSVCTEQCDAAELSSSLNNMKDHLSSESPCNIQEPNNFDTVHEMASIKHSSSGEPSLYALSGQRQQLHDNISLCSGNKDFLLDVQHNFIAEREKHKESDLFKRAAEEEWASRQEQLKIQAEEAQRLRRRKRAETMRLLDMEKRQKQRLEEVRELQKKDEETINLKEKFRAEVRKELSIMEMLYRDMASLLRALGVHVGGGHFPLSHEVNAAYKKALLKFHPDRASRSDIRQQVEAEEKFKLISRLKEKLLPV